MGFSVSNCILKHRLGRFYWPEAQLMPQSCLYRGFALTQLHSLHSASISVQKGEGRLGAARECAGSVDP